MQNEIMHGSRLMASSGKGEFTLVVFLLEQFVITATTAIGFRDCGGPIEETKITK